MNWQSTFAHDLQKQHPPLSAWKLGHALRYPILKWQRRLRWLEAATLANPGPLRRTLIAVVKFIHLRDSIRLGFSIPPHCFGPGLSIAHWGTIAVDSKARIGSNCRIHQGVTIGSSKGRSPTIGDDCFIGANATIIGGIVIGNNVRIGANALVNRSFPDDAVLAGVPATDVRKTG